MDITHQRYKSPIVYERLLRQQIMFIYYFYNVHRRRLTGAFFLFLLIHDRQ